MLLLRGAGDIIGVVESQVVQSSSRNFNKAQIIQESRVHATSSLELNSVLLETDHKVPGHELTVQLDQILVGSLIPKLCWTP